MYDWRGGLVLGSRTNETSCSASQCKSPFWMKPYFAIHHSLTASGERSDWLMMCTVGEYIFQEFLTAKFVPAGFYTVKGVRVPTFPHSTRWTSRYELWRPSGEWRGAKYIFSKKMFGEKTLSKENIMLTASAQGIFLRQITISASSFTGWPPSIAPDWATGCSAESWCTSILISVPSIVNSQLFMHATYLCVAKVHSSSFYSDLFQGAVRLLLVASWPRIRYRKCHNLRALTVLICTIANVLVDWFSHGT